MLGVTTSMRRPLLVATAAVLLAACSSGSDPSTSGPATTASQSGTVATVPQTPSDTSTNALTVQVAPAPVDPSAATTTQGKVASASPPAGIRGLLAWNTGDYPGPGTPGPGALAHNHVNGPVSYSITPPVGGPHAPIWMNAGVYTVAVPTERAVHDLEHGAVWITYDPALPADQVQALTAFVARQTLIPETSENQPAGQANRYVVMSPWATSALPTPIVISSWGYQLRVSDAADPRLQNFVDTFRSSQQYSPEFGSPVDGIPTGTGGVAASNGAAVPNPGGVVS